RGFSALILAAVVGGGSADLAGQPVGSEFRVNTYTTGAQSSPAVLTFPTTPSPFVVAWDGEGVGDRDGIFFRRFSAPAAPLGSDLRANTTVAIGASQVDLAAFGADLAGGFVIVWTAQGTGSSDVRARRFGGASSTPVGVDFRVNASSSGYHSDASVATAANGDFVVVWADTPSGDSPSTVQARRFSSSAAPLGAEFRLDSSTTGTGGSDVAADATGGFVVIWSQLDGDGHGIFMQRMSAAGSLVGTALRVNVATTGDQTRPVIAGGRWGVPGRLERLPDRSRERGDRRAAPRFAREPGGQRVQAEHLHQLRAGERGSRRRFRGQFSRGLEIERPGREQPVRPRPPPRWRRNSRR
ncbi:MAG TPA: hypothetical protein VKF32_09535, partial [Thermoanaerobaculia bacterium]|nr:hypothetical protein [Thermoanaerobaculia bacterium]